MLIKFHKLEEKCKTESTLSGNTLCSKLNACSTLTPPIYTFSFFCSSSNIPSQYQANSLKIHYDSNLILNVMLMLTSLSDSRKRSTISR